MATDSPNSSDSASGKGDGEKEPTSEERPRISLRKLSSGKKASPPKDPSPATDPPPEPPESPEPPDSPKSDELPESPESHELPESPSPEASSPEEEKPRWGLKRTASQAAPSDDKEEEAKTPSPEAEKTVTRVPGRTPRHLRMRPAKTQKEKDKPEKSGKKRKRSPNGKGPSSRTPGFVLLLLVAALVLFMLPWNPYSPFTDKAAPEPSTIDPAKVRDAPPTTEEVAEGPEAKPNAPSSQSLSTENAATADKVKEGSVPDLMRKLRNATLHLSHEPRGLFINRVFYPLDSLVDPGTGLRLIAVETNIRRPVAVFLTPDGEAHTLPLSKSPS